MPRHVVGGLKLFLFLRVDTAGPVPGVLIDPTVAFGRPIITGSGISTAAIADRVDAGEAVKEVADDYGISAQQVREALVYERAA